MRNFPLYMYRYMYLVRTHFMVEFVCFLSVYLKIRCRPIKDCLFMYSNMCLSFTEMSWFAYG